MCAIRATLVDSEGMTTTSFSSRAWSLLEVPMRRPITDESMKLALREVAEDVGVRGGPLECLRRARARC